jgi:hypothetical protein
VDGDRALVEFLAEVTGSADMAESLAGVDVAFAAEKLREYLAADEDSQADIRAFFESDGDQRVRAKARIEREVEGRRRRPRNGR